MSVKRFGGFVLLAIFLASSVQGAHVVFDGGYQNGWSGLGTVSFDGSVCIIAGGNQWEWRNLLNTSGQDMGGLGYFEYEIYFASAGGGSRVEWHVIAPDGKEWNGTYQFMSPMTIDGAPSSYPHNMSADAWHTVRLDCSAQSWWSADCHSIRYVKWQCPLNCTAYIRTMRFVQAPNAAPAVEAGEDQNIFQPDCEAVLNGSVSDDGLPVPPGQVTSTWEMVSGPAAVSFANAGAAVTAATFTAVGEYELKLTANDGELTSSDTVTITVYEEGHNLAPVVNAGPDQQITLPDDFISLEGVVTDDGFPDPPGQVTTTWEMVSGPAPLFFDNASSTSTYVTFTDAGTYVLRLSAGDGDVVTSDELTVTVYPQGTMLLYGKFEKSFQVDTTAENLQMPYDASPPPGITAGQGITVDVLFTPDGWQTVYTQPAFYYDDYECQTINGKDWIYPTGYSCWKVRFTPDKPGVWQYKIVTTDAGGTTESAIDTFNVLDEWANKGFVRVSEDDARYFEFANGEHFLGLGHNLKFNDCDWDNPIQTNEPRFQTLHGYGAQFFRVWLSQWGIYTAFCSPWTSPDPALHAIYIPDAGMDIGDYYPGHDVSMKLVYDYRPVMWVGHLKKAPAVKPYTNYVVRILYKIPTALSGPRIAGHPYGFVAKVSDWNDYLFDPDQGTVITDYAYEATSGWQVLEGSFNSGNNYWIPGSKFSLCLENVNVGSAVYIDKVEVCEDLGGGALGPNIMVKPYMNKHQYMDQRLSFAFDKALELAEQYDIYFKLVVMDKNDWILNRILFNGTMTNDWDSSNTNFYGNYSEVTKVRWLQQAWWRYCQARWGWSTKIQSWELCNEADPWSGRHYAQANEFAGYMHQFGNKHPATTSFWSDWPRSQFWGNASYPNLDYGDFHRYETSIGDVASNTNYWSTRYGAYCAEGVGKPIVRGETGFNEDVNLDTDKIWMHNFIWGTINRGGMYEQYWCENDEFNQGLDPRVHFRPFKDFMNGIPLNKGGYSGIVATCAAGLRAYGQTNAELGKSHVWIQNTAHTFRNIVDGNPIPAVSGTVGLAGFRANKKYRVEWFDTYATASRTAIFKDGDFVWPWASASTGGSYDNLPFEAGTAPDGSGAAYADIWTGNAGLWMRISNSGSKDIGGNHYLEFDVYFDTTSSPGHTLAAMHMDVNGDGGWNYKWENTSRCWVDGVLTDMDDGIPGNDLPMTGNQWHHFKLDLLDNVSPTVPFGGPIPLPENPAIGIIRLYFAGVSDGADVYIKNMCFSSGSDSDGVITSTEYLTANGAGSLTLSVTELSTDIAVKVTGVHGDLDNDMDVDYDDLSTLVDDWLGTGAGGADIAPANSPDGVVNFVDFAKLAQNWLEMY